MWKFLLSMPTPMFMTAIASITVPVPTPAGKLVLLVNANLSVTGPLMHTWVVRVGEKRLKEEGMEAFNKFDQEISGVDAALRLLGSTMQLFGSSVGVLHAIYRLRKSLMRLQFHVRENAARLYEGFIEPSEKREIQDIKPDMKANGHINPPRSWKAPAVPKNSNEAKEKRYQDIHGSMDQVGDNLERFMERINEISGFHDELINQTFAAFSGELKHRAAVLRRLKYRPNTAFKERINKLSVVFGQHLEGMREALKSFQKNSIPVIQLSQERRGLGLQGLSAVATFFSGINATAIQYQLNEPPTLLRSAVNGLLITSLACSAASAVSAQVVYFCTYISPWLKDAQVTITIICTGRISKFSSPSKYTPGFIAHILQYTPLIYLCVHLRFHVHGWIISLHIQ
ncbi:unnamed protein product [Rhizoctonia solani]|uniref:Uncharacterized protein n=1 Tax=Rhizoctonia solani TaxID=456999 RepID=A0A8H3H6C4_9AGAM|nr:unnamed protein product [Rhizoctonia solani]